MSSYTQNVDLFLFYLSGFSHLVVSYPFVNDKMRGTQKCHSYPILFYSPLRLYFHFASKTIPAKMRNENIVTPQEQIRAAVKTRPGHKLFKCAITKGDSSILLIFFHVFISITKLLNLYRRNLFMHKLLRTIAIPRKKKQ